MKRNESELAYPNGPAERIGEILAQERRPLLLVSSLALVLALWFLNPFIGHWDSYDYMKYILTGQRTSLMLGRPYFVLYNYGLVKLAALFGLPAAHAYLVVKFTVVLLSAVASGATYLFFRELVERRAALIAALLATASPVYAVYSGMVMTEIPMLAFSYLGLWLYLVGLRRGRAPELFWGAASIGFAIGVREQALFVTPLLLLLPLIRKRASWGLVILSWGVGLLVCCAGPAYLLVTDPGYWPTMKKWLAFMDAEKKRHPIDWSNLTIWAKWLVANQPLGTFVFPVGLVQLVRRRRELPLATGFVALQTALLVSLAGYQDLLYSPRYLMIAIPGLALGAALPLARWYESSRRQRWLVAAFSVVLAAVLSVSFIVTLPYRPVFSKARSYHERIASLGPRSVFVVGQYCPYIGYLKAVGYPRSWDVICAGWTWPRERLRSVIDAHLAAGQQVYIDLDAHLWYGPRLQQDLSYWTRIAPSYRLDSLGGTLHRIRRR